MFERIAQRYSLVNRLMTLGQDIHWRQEVIHLAQLKSGDLLLDLGSGTGDLAFEAKRQHPLTRVIGADSTFNMLNVGRHRGSLLCLVADALYLPFN